MKLITLGMAVALAVGSVGLAYATPTNLITNGDFSQTQSPVANPTIPTGFGSLGGGVGGVYGGGSCTTGDFITGWAGNGGYEIWYNNYTVASTVQPCAYYHSENQMLSAITDPSAAGASFTSFVGMDGISSPVPNAGISQSVGGLTAGQKYKVTFWFGNTQLQNRSGPTTEQLQVSLGSETQNFPSPASSIGTHGWSGWSQATMYFTASSTTEILNFLSMGTPNSLPPFALLGGVSMQAVPEPPELAMFGAGLLGLGLLTVFARRRALRRNGAGDDLV